MWLAAARSLRGSHGDRRGAGGWRDVGARRCGAQDGVCRACYSGIRRRARSGQAGATRSLSVNVARYDQQAVLMANVEEARYQVLMSADGKELVQARYAVRNNQRNFVKVTLPAGATEEFGAITKN